MRSFSQLTLALLAALLLATLALASARPGSADDAFVVLVYARELLAGGGFAYAAGGPPLDGFTSLLDLLVKAAAVGVWDEDPVTTLWVATGVLYLGAVAALSLLAAWTGLRSGRPWTGLVAALAFALAPGLAEGSSYLLETPLLALAIAAMASGVRLEDHGGGWRGDGLAAGAGLALTLTRPEALPVAGFLLFVRLRRGPGRSRAFKLWLVGAAAFLAWRVATFGSWAPNSYHAKTSDSRLSEVGDGLVYVGSLVRGIGAEGVDRLAGVAAAACVLGLVLPFLPPRAATGTGAGGPSWSRAYAGAGALALAALILSGGDGYSGARLFAPVALWCLLGAAEVALRSSGFARVAATAVLATVAGARAVRVTPNAAEKLSAIPGAAWSSDDFACGRRVARLLERLLPDAPLAHRHFQQARWFAPDLAVIDLTGLNDRDIARRPAPGAVRFGRSEVGPALEARAGALLLHHAIVGATALADRPLSATLDDPGRVVALLGAPPPETAARAALLEGYVAASLPDACGPGTWLNLLVRADLADRFRSSGFVVAD